MLESLFIKAFRWFPVNISKLLRAAFFIEHLWWLLLQMFCSALYFQKDVAEYIVVLHCIIVSFWNLKPLLLLSFCCTTLYYSLNHSLSFVVSRCHSLSFIVTRCHSLSLVATRCNTRSHSLSWVVPLVVICCHSLSFVIFRCITRCHSMYYCSVFL